MFDLITLFKDVMATADPSMAVWVIVVMTMGYWLKRTGNLPSWLPPLPVLLFGAFLIVALFFGLLTNESEGWKGVAYVVSYAIGNAFLYTGMSFIFYDIAHAYTKRHCERKALKEGEEDA